MSGYIPIFDDTRTPVSWDVGRTLDILSRDLGSLPPIILLLVVGMITVWYTCKLAYHSCCSWFTRSRTTRLLNLFKITPKLCSESIKKAFMDLPFTESRLTEGHTHPVAAADRSSATSFIVRLASMLGRSPYLIQRSRSDERKGLPGSRDYYWAKDLTTQPSPFNIPSNPLVALVDVDEYVDMPDFLNEHVNPTIIYTFQPNRVAHVGVNYSYTFDEKNVVTYNVSGGGMYTHRVWNYSVDHLVVASEFPKLHFWWLVVPTIISCYFLSQFGTEPWLQTFALFLLTWFLWFRCWSGIPWYVTIYAVERRATSSDHEVIMLMPLGSWHGPIAYFAARWLPGRKLERLRLAVKIPLKTTTLLDKLRPPTVTFLRLMSSSLEGVFMSTGRPGYYSSATIPIVKDNTIASIARTSKYPLTLPTVLPYVDGDKEAGCVLLEYHLVGNDDKPDVVCPVAVAVRRYQFKPERFDPSAKPGMVCFMHPLVADAFSPDRTLGNEIQCVEDRIENIRPKELLISGFLADVMSEFIQHLIPDNQAHTLDPVDEDELMRRQPRPTQRRILADAEYRSPERKVSTFMKVESYGNVKPPRPISVMDGVDKRNYSKFLYAFEAVLKRQPWYAFALTPKLVAARVAAILLEANMATNTDFHKFDGHGSDIMRELEQRILMRAFRVRHHASLLELHKAQFNLKAYGTFGTQYQTRFARASGSPETSLFNSLVNAFVSYLAIRMSKVDGIYVPSVTAYSRLGIYGGDDGITCDVNPGILRAAASMIGQDLATVPIHRGHPGIVFLARVYSPDVWFGDENTCCDLPRQLSKLHVTHRVDSTVTPAMKLLEKARCFLLSDENTPIIGDYCRRVAYINDHSSVGAGSIPFNPKASDITLWGASWEKEFQYHNESADWMLSYAQSSLPDFNYARFLTWVDETKSIDDLLVAPTFQEPVLAKSSAPVVIADTVIPHDYKYPVPSLRSEETKAVLGTNGPISMPKGALVSSVAPVKVASRSSAEFLAWKTDLQTRGLWIDKPPKKVVRPVATQFSGSNPTRTKMTPEEFAAWKANKVRLGVWHERPGQRRGAVRAAPRSAQV